MKEDVKEGNRRIASKEYFRISVSFPRKKLPAISFMTMKLWPLCDKNSVRQDLRFPSFQPEEIRNATLVSDRDGNSVIVAVFAIIGLKISSTLSRTGRLIKHTFHGVLR